MPQTFNSFEDYAIAFRNLILESNVRYPEAPISIRFAKSTIWSLMAAIAGGRDRDPEDCFRGFLNHRECEDFGYAGDLVSHAAHAVRFNEALITITVNLSMKTCPGILIRYITNLLQNYASDHELREAFLDKLAHTLKKPDISVMLKLHLYRAQLAFDVSQEALSHIYNDTKDILKKLNVDAHKEHALAYIVRARCLLKQEIADNDTRLKIHKKAFKYLKRAETHDSEMAQDQIACMYMKGLVADCQQHETEAIRIFQQIQTEHDLSTNLNLAMLCHKLAKNNQFTAAERDANEQEHLRLLREGCKQGHLLAIANLGIHYMAKVMAQYKRTHTYDERELIYARGLLNLAHAKGYNNATIAIQRLNKCLAPLSTKPAASSSSATSKVRFLVPPTDNKRSGSTLNEPVAKVAKLTPSVIKK